MYIRFKKFRPIRPCNHEIRTVWIILRRNRNLKFRGLSSISIMSEKEKWAITLFHLPNGPWYNQITLYDFSFCIHFAKVFIGSLVIYNYLYSFRGAALFWPLGQTPAAQVYTVKKIYICIIIQVFCVSSRMLKLL